MGLGAFLGQDAVKAKIKFQIELAKKQSVAINHTLLCGPDGEGKGFLSKCIAEEMQVGIKTTEGNAIERSGDLAAILTNLRAGDILLIEHIERLNQQCASSLLLAIREFAMDIDIGKGPTERRIRLKMPRFTLIGTASHQGAVRESLRHAFDVILDFGAYNQISLATILLQAKRNDRPELGATATSEIAKRANGSLQTARKLARQVEDYAIHQDHSIITEKVVLEAFGIFGIETNSNQKDKTGIAFEQMCMELLRRRNFEVKSTQRTADGGIDLIAWSSDPFISGKYIVQCKDWTSPVGAPIVRDLYGVVHSEDANKGILITASSFTQEALDFATGKRLELVDGRKLNYLIGQ